MFPSRVSQAGLTAGAVAASVCLSSTGAQAAELASANFDADSYLAFGTNNASSPEISVGAHIPAAPTPGSHFTFGVITFDVAGLSAAGDKHLHLDLEVFRTTVVGPTGPTGEVEDLTTGNATLRLVALDDGYADYATAPDRRGWYDTNLFGQDPIASIALSSAGLFSIDVTDAVNAWIADAGSNHGFGLVVENGTPIELGATEGGNGPVLSSVAVPEPGTLALLGLGGLLAARRRR